MVVGEHVSLSMVTRKLIQSGFWVDGIVKEDPLPYYTFLLIVSGEKTRVIELEQKIQAMIEPVKNTKGLFGSQIIEVLDSIMED